MYSRWQGGWRARWRRLWRPPASDAAVAVGVAAVLVLASYGEAHPGNPRAYFTGSQHVPYTPAAAYLLVAAACLVLAGRRRWPAAVLACSTAAVTAYSLLGYVNGAALVAPLIAIYTLATVVSWRRAVAWAAGTLAVLMAATGVNNPFGISGGGFDVLPFLVAAVCLGGIAVGNRRAYVESIRDRAEQDARRRVDDERLRIARELHDVVAHTMATINVQAGAAAHVLADRPDKAAEALAAIRAASKEGLAELRAILQVLRQVDEADPTQPAPGVSRLGALVAGVCRAGLETTLTVRGTPRPLPAAVDLAAYRIVQESLTNAIRHAGRATAAVSLSYQEAFLVVEVSDTGRGSPLAPLARQAPPQAAGPGHGLAGMRERASAVGGTLQAGPAPAGGFLVMARLPLAAGDERAADAPAQAPAPARGSRR